MPRPWDSSRLFLPNLSHSSNLRPIPQPLQIPMVCEGAVALFAGGFLKYVGFAQHLDGAGRGGLAGL